MTALEELHRIYEEYDKKARKVRSKASRFAGAFSLGDDPRKHECHEDFFDDVGRWVEAFLKTQPAEQEVASVVQWILEAADANRDTDVYWMMYAAQGHVKELIPRMSREDCSKLLTWYEDTYPAVDRLPAQREIVRRMHRYCGAENRKSSGLFGFLNRKK